MGQTFGVDPSHGRPFSLLRFEEELSAAHLRLAGATIEHLDGAACIARYDRPSTFFYVDPPYWETEGYGVPFPLEAYHQMAALARSIQGRMLSSINDHSAMREAFAGLRIVAAARDTAFGGWWWGTWRRPQGSRTGVAPIASRGAGPRFGWRWNW